MKVPVLAVLAVAAVAGGAYALTRNEKPAAELPRKPKSKRLVRPVHRLMHEEFGSGPGQHDPIEASGD